MRRLFTVPKLLILFSSFLLLPLISCGEDSGLGASIDTKSPVLSIEYPESGVAIRDSFILAGTCSDDKKIAKITVTVRSLDKDEDDKGFVDDSFLADMALDELSWSITLNEYDDSNPNYFNGWKYADGKYEVGVTAFDNAGNNSGTYSRTFEIDNNPPVFVISNPGVVKGSGLTPSAYGSIFTIDGTISDNHTVSFMDVKIFDVNGECVSSETYDGESLPFFREEDIATAGGTSVQIAQFGSSQNQRYATIHPEDHGTEYYYAQITLTDNTKAYKNPPKSSARTAEELESDSCGNSSSKVYLYDSVYKTLMSSRNGMGLSAANLKDILAGLETNDEALAILNENIIDTAARSDDDTMAGKLSFSLNPESNPIYNVNGFGLHFGNGTDQTASCGNTVSVTVTAGLDGTNVAPDSVKLWIKHLNEKPSDPAALKEDLKKLQVEVTKLENNEYDFIVEADKSADNPTTTIHTDDAGEDWLLIYDYFQGNDRKKSSSVSTKTFSVMLPTEGISLGAYYIFGVTGYDAEDVVFAQDTVYGFVGNAAGVPPTITFVSPENLAVMNEFSTFTGTASVASADYYVAAVKADFTVTDAGTNEIIGEFSDEITSKKNSSGQLVWQPSDIGIGALSWSGEDTWSFDPSKIQELMALYDAKVKVSDTNDGAYWLCTLKITGVSSSSHDSFSTGSIHIDTVNPVVSIASITPTVSGGEYFGAGDENTYLNGKIAIRGNVVENQNLKEGEDAVTYDIWASTDLTKELTQEDSILSGLIEHKDEYGVEFDGKLGRAYAISLADFPTTVITKYFDDYKGSDGDQKIQIELIFTAEDKAGNKGSYSSKALNGGKNFVIYQETDRPKIVLENVSSDVKTASAISTEQNLFGTKSNNKMSVTFSDDDTVNTVVVTLYDKDGNKISDESSYYGINPYSMNPKKSSYALRYVLPETEGVYKVSIAAMDGNYIETDVSDADSMNKNVLQDFFIAVDSGAPNVIIDTPSGFKTDGFEIRGSITPSSKVFGADKCSIKAVFIDENENEL
ncbi:MAG: hypothetical protein IJ630_12900, partial [Treponema sp.]|nr:hypothetical protein [Treponema sp.]